jgi:hypothetical protein
MDPQAEMEAEELLYAVGLRKRHGTRPLVPHGTAAAYARHLKHGDEPCDACRAANAEQKRGQKANPDKPGRRTDIPHGTPQGYRRHLYRREPACEPCLQASAAAQRARTAAKKTA